MQPFLERLKQDVLVCDGAMGTMLTGGMQVDYSTEALNINEPQRVLKVHQAYVDAGAQILQTNTFGANELVLKRFGLESKVEEINTAGVVLAKQIAVPRGVYVAGSVWPNGKGSYDVYKRQIEALIAAGVDLLILETIGYVDGALAAIKAVRDVSKDLPILAQIACFKDFTTKSGVDAETFVRILNEQPVDAIGFNCYVGPKTWYPIMVQAKQWTNKPVSIQPNIGEVTFSEQELYGASDVFGMYTKKFLNAGAKIIGGCCGTTPQQIKTIAKTVQSYKPEVKVVVHAEPKQETIVVKDRQSVLERMLTQKRPFPIVEIDPPVIGESPQQQINLAERLYDLGCLVFTIADNPGAVPRMGNIGFASLLTRKVPYAQIILHMSCRDQTMITAESKISEAEALGIHNVLAITGDPPAAGPYDKSIAVNNFQSISLLRLLNQRNKGRNALGESVAKSTLYLGCGFDCGRFTSEKLKLKTKYLAGADFALTQIISDVATVNALANYMREATWTDHPFYMIPGTYVFRSLGNMEFLKESLRVKIAPETFNRMASYKTRKAQQECGYDIAKEVVLAAKEQFPAVYIVPPIKNSEIVVKLVKETNLV